MVCGKPQAWLNSTEWQKDGCCCCGYQLSVGSLMDNVICVDASVDSDFH